MPVLKMLLKFMAFLACKILRFLCGRVEQSSASAMTELWIRLCMCIHLTVAVIKSWLLFKNRALQEQLKRVFSSSCYGC